jgi:hypothetical protein
LYDEGDTGVVGCASRGGERTARQQQERDVGKVRLVLNRRLQALLLLLLLLLPPSIDDSCTRNNVEQTKMA